MSAMHELFSPQGSNPLTNLKVGNPRCSKVEFDRTVRSNVLVIEGDLTQSRVQIPKEDRPVSSLQLNHSLVVLQIMIPSSGQFLLELNVSNSPMTRMRLSAATFISRADVVDAKGMAHAKIPLVIPRNCWVQIVFHVGGIFTHLFRLPAVKWIDSVILAGSCKVRKVMTCADEAVAIESKPGGMLLFAVPAYGPPVWQTSGGGAVAQRNAGGGGANNDSTTARSVEASDSPASLTQQAPTGSGSDSPTPANEVSNRTVVTTATASVAHQKPAAGGAADGEATTSPSSAPPSPITAEAQSARRSQGGKLTSPASSSDSTTHASAQAASSAPPASQGASVSSPLRMKFLKGDDGSVSFTASNPEQAARDLTERRNQMNIVENLKREAETLRIREEYEKQRRQQEEADRQNQYVRIVEVQTDNGVNPISGRRPTLTNSNADQPSDAQPMASPTTATGGNLAMGGNSSNSVSTIRKTSIAGLARGGGQQQVPASSSRGAGGGGGSNGTPPSAATLDGGLGCWDDEDGNIFSSMLAGGMGTFVVQTLNAGGKPIVVPRKGDDVAQQGQQPLAAGGGGGGRASGPQRGSMPTRKPHVVLRKPQPGPMGARPKRKPTQPPSMLLLALRPTQGDSHPADDYDPEAYRRPEPDIGYGCGFMDVLHGEDEEYEEDEEDEDD